MGEKTTSQARRFQKNIKTRTDKGVPRLIAIYQALEQFSASKPDAYACCAGCCQCCYQIVAITIEEANIIAGYLAQMKEPLRSVVLHTARQRADAFTAWAKETNFQGCRTPKEMHDFHNAHTGHPCVFLDEATGRCIIYPVRPMVCRTYHSTTKCQSPDWPDVVQISTDIERIANNMALAHEAGVYPMPPMVLLILAQ